jgi:hypothetical protein
MSSELTLQARRLLQHLEERLSSVVPGRPETYAQYKDVHDVLQLSMQGKTFGESLQRQGLESLARWCIQHNLPAITGLVVSGASFEPGEGFFRVHDRNSDEYDWCRETCVSPYSAT